MIKFSDYKAPYFDIMVASTSIGICQLEFTSNEIRFVKGLKQKYCVPISRDNKHFNKLKKELDVYFGGRPVFFSVPLDIKGSDFQNKVWAALLKIPYGEVRTYEDIAREIGSARAFRAVGNAIGKNPVPLIIPCHRVIKKDGELGGFSAGKGLKKLFLKIEGQAEYT